MKIQISKIQIADRTRKDLGDIKPLAESIKKHGLLHPVVITGGEFRPVLVAGARRIAAALLLGWTHIDATNVSLDPRDYLTAEADENVLRKPFTPTEMYEVSRKILEREEAEAKGRMTSGKTAEPYTKLVQGKKRAPTAKDIAALQVGTVKETLRKIETVIEAAASNPEKYQDIVDAMDETDNVSAALRELKKRQREERIKEQSRKVRVEKKKAHHHRLYQAGDFSMVEDNSVDLVIGDPPYNLSTARLIEFDGERAAMSNNFGQWDWIPEKEYLEHLEDWSAEFFRVLGKGGSAYSFTSEAYMSYFRAALIKAGFQFKNTLAWARPNPKPKPDKTSYVAACDFIVFAVKPGADHTFNYTKHNQMLSFISMPSANGAERSTWGHPTQKPIKLIKKLVQVSSNPGDTVLDPFAGSGTTGEACQKTGRRFILVERNKGYVQMIEARTGVKHANVRAIPKVY